MKPQPGEMAPDFTAPVVGGDYEDGARVTLSDLRGERVVLVFYPRDRTPGCTTQACALRDGWEGIRDKARIFGVSTDDEKSHRKFIERDGLPYPLIADTDRRLVESYGVWAKKSLYGKFFMGTERCTFVIGPDGRIETVLSKVSPRKHLDQLSEVLG